MSPSAMHRAVRWSRQRPDPARLWIGVAPQGWPGPDGEWVDLAAGGMGRSLAALDPSAPPPELLDDLVYLPPVAPPAAPLRDAVARACLEAGAPVLLQLRPGEDSAVEGCLPVYDLTEPLLEQTLETLRRLPRGAAVLWPLVADLTDGEELRRRGLERLEAAGIACVRGLALQLDPADRRRLAELGDEETFHRLFHGEPPSEREFARAAHEIGLSPFVDRPLPVSPRRAANRRLGALMALVAELWLRLGRPEAQGQIFYRAARWIDRSEHDLAALCREGNLPVVSWLDSRSRQVIEEYVARDESALLRELEAEYLTATP
jgi:hypothetical protein